MRKIGGKKKEPDRVVVTTKEQLKSAVNRKEAYIEIQGDLARKLQWMGKLSSGRGCSSYISIRSDNNIDSISVKRI